MAELLILMVIGLVVLVPVVIAFVVISNRRGQRPVLPDFAPGSRVVSQSATDPRGTVGTLVRTDNAYALIDVDGTRRFVPRESLRPIVDRGPIADVR